MQYKNIKDIILYEDRSILVCRKPAGTAVQSARIGTPDMESLIKNYLAEKSPGKIPYLGIVHRLDQPVEGILAFAKTSGAAGILGRQIALKEWKKEYYAVSDRLPSAKNGELRDFLRKNGRTNLSEVVQKGTAGAKEARLTFSFVKEVSDKRTAFGRRCLFHILLDTGRHHQIRVQMAHAGMPLLGDRKYNPEDISGFSLALCACHLELKHPATGKKLEFSICPEGEAFFGLLPSD